MRLEALEIEGVVDRTESVDSIDVTLSVSKNGEAVVVGELVELVDSIDVTFSASKNGEAMSDRELISIV